MLIQTDLDCLHSLFSNSIIELSSEPLGVKKLLISFNCNEIHKKVII